MRTFIYIVLFILLSTILSAQDTLQYRIAYYPTWAYDELPPWNIDWNNGLTHIVLFSDGNVSNTSPYWSPTTSTDYGFSKQFLSQSNNEYCWQ